MPNIIEQQDLLKGLPDTRLAMLLQNPVADIPPFLVAAEAQRRQAIRQQFAASSPQESVVDSLTKQIASVPQNIQSSAQTPPNVPPTPQMQGVMALQQQQAMQDAAQQVQPQQMRAGGPVRRFAGEGYVAPSFRGRQGAGGYAPGEEPSGFAIIPDILGDINEATAPFLENVKRFGLTPSPEQAAIIEEERAARERKDRIFPELPPNSSSGTAFTTATAKPKVEPGKDGTSPENQATPKPLAGETEEDYRARVEELFAAQEPSDWEKAQRWFAMAEQFLDPSKTTGQSIAGAGRAFADMTGEQARAMRDAELQQKKALLEYDISERDRQREIAAQRAEREYDRAQKIEDRLYEAEQKKIERMNPTATDVLRSYQQLIESKTKAMAEEMDPERKEAMRLELNGLLAAQADLIKRSGLGPGGTVTEEQLRALAGTQ